MSKITSRIQIRNGIKIKSKRKSISNPSMEPVVVKFRGE